MAWTAPRTWASGEVPTAAQFNAHIRDNFGALDQHSHDGSAGDGAVLPQYDIWGTGADGAKTVSGTETLTAGKNYTTLTVPSGTTLITDGFICKATVKIDVQTGGILHNDGATGSGRTSPGVGGPKGDYPAGGRSGNVGWFGDTIPGGPFTGLDATNEDETETESDSGGGGNFTGGGTGSIGDGPAYGGAGGGGGGAAAVGDNSQGGSGGGGGGPLDLRTPVLDGDGTIRSNGGAGASGSSTVGGGAGGGGGGGGGWMRTITLGPISTGLTVQVNGGSGGGAVNGGSAGQAGSVGRIEHVVFDSTLTPP